MDILAWHWRKNTGVSRWSALPNCRLHHWNHHHHHHHHHHWRMSWPLALFQTGTLRQIIVTSHWAQGPEVIRLVVGRQENEGREWILRRNHQIIIFVPAQFLQTNDMFTCVHIMSHYIFCLEKRSSSSSSLCFYSSRPDTISLYNFNKTNIFKETSGQFPAMFVARKAGF